MTDARVTRRNWVRRSTAERFRDVLRELYVDRRHTQQEIADALA